MSDYRLKWITESVAAGHAPGSYADLDFIRSQGIDAIVNLCGEYCDLHDIEGQNGFAVHYLAIPDECAPDMQEVGEAIAWMEERIAQGGKVLVHCRFGIGRTGTMLMAYLMKNGLDMRAAEKALKGSPAAPAKHCQWKMLKKYRKKLNR